MQTVDLEMLHSRICIELQVAYIADLGQSLHCLCLAYYWFKRFGMSNLVVGNHLLVYFDIIRFCFGYLLQGQTIFFRF